ncbi:hypothetical protein ['Chrysanthemum coronarium' phytoplasma]|uniref:hypothetical protein n=1 Tax='Chrysanthemum coronarium' phytoplasma TaxID=1520703 RepID=UPI00030FE41E|nr:hypothetical protein ['Chrysanthemum coronarium' phytoplasma]
MGWVVVCVVLLSSLTVVTFLVSVSFSVIVSVVVFPSVVVVVTSVLVTVPPSPKVLTVTLLSYGSVVVSVLTPSTV